MALSKFLKNQGYDLINGPVRSHQPLQLWLKRIFNEAELYYADVHHAFASEVVLQELENPALKVDSSQKDTYAFNIGITVLEQVLESIGLGRLELTANIKSGKEVRIGYDHSFTKEYPTGNLESFFHKGDFLHPNPSLLKNANRNDLLILSGTLFAKHLVAEIETNFDLKADLIVELNELANGNLKFSKKGNQTIQLVSENGNFFPIAVKANKIDFDRGQFDKLKLVSDNRNFF